MPSSDKTSTQSSGMSNNSISGGGAMLPKEPTASPPSATITGILNRRTASSPTSAFVALASPISSSNCLLSTQTSSPSSASSGMNADHKRPRLIFDTQQQKKKKNMFTTKSSCFPEDQPKLEDIQKKAVENQSCMNHNQDQSYNLSNDDDRQKHTNSNFIAASTSACSQPTTNRLAKYTPMTSEAATEDNSHGEEKEVANARHGTLNHRMENNSSNSSPKNLNDNVDDWCRNSAGGDDDDDSFFGACEMQFEMELEESKVSHTTTTTTTTHHDKSANKNQGDDAIIAHTFTSNSNSNGNVQEPEQDGGALGNPQLLVTDDEKNSASSHDDDAAEEEWAEESNALLAVALHNYDMFHSWKLGTAGVDDLERSSAGVAGWASASFTATTTASSSSPDYDDRPAATAAPIARKKCDEEDDMQLRIALLQSLGVQADCKAFMSSHKIIYESQEFDDGDSFDYDDDVVRDQENLRDATSKIDEDSNDDNDDYSYEDDYDYDDDDNYDEEDDHVDHGLFNSDIDDDQEKDGCKNHATSELDQKAATKDSIKNSCVTDDKREEDFSIESGKSGKSGKSGMKDSISSGSENSDSESYDLIRDMEKYPCDTNAAACAATSNACADNAGTNLLHEEDNQEESSDGGYHVVESHLPDNAGTVPARVVVAASGAPSTLTDIQTATSSTPINRNKRHSTAPKVNRSSWQFQSFMKHVQQPVKSSTANTGKTTASSRSTVSPHLSSFKNNDDSSSESDWSLIDKDE